MCLLEHYIDQELGSGDSEGNEGGIFAQPVRGETIGDDELAVLEAEDDSATIFFNGKKLARESSHHRLPVAAGVPMTVELAESSSPTREQISGCLQSRNLPSVNRLPILRQFLTAIIWFKNRNRLWLGRFKMETRDPYKSSLL